MTLTVKTKARATDKTKARAKTKGGYVPPLTITHEGLLTNGDDSGFRAVVYLMTMVFSRLQTCRETFGKALGLTGTQFVVLFGVAHIQKDHGVGIRTLSDHLSIAQPHVTTEVGRLVDMGLLSKDQSSDDGRSVLITLTELGKERVAEVSPLVCQVNDHLFNDLDTGDFETFRRCLMTVASNSELALAELKRYRLQASAATSSS